MYLSTIFIYRSFVMAEKENKFISTPSVRFRHSMKVNYYESHIYMQKKCVSKWPYRMSWPSVCASITNLQCLKGKHARCDLARTNRLLTTYREMLFCIVFTQALHKAQRYRWYRCPMLTLARTHEFECFTPWCNVITDECENRHYHNIIIWCAGRCHVNIFHYATYIFHVPNQIYSDRGWTFVRTPIQIIYIYLFTYALCVVCCVFQAGDIYSDAYFSSVQRWRSEYDSFWQGNRIAREHGTTVRTGGLWVVCGIDSPYGHYRIPSRWLYYASWRATSFSWQGMVSCRTTEAPRHRTTKAAPFGMISTAFALAN